MLLIRLNTFFSDSRHDLQRNLKKIKLQCELETNRDSRVDAFEEYCGFLSLVNNTTCKFFF